MGRYRHRMEAGPPIKKWLSRDARDQSGHLGRLVSGRMLVDRQKIWRTGRISRYDPDGRYQAGAGLDGTFLKVKEFPRMGIIAGSLLVLEIVGEAKNFVFGRLQLHSPGIGDT